MKIFLDMDGVCVDFVSGVMEVFDITQQQINEHWEPGVYDIQKVFEKILREPIPYFWQTLNTITSFWENLKPYPWYKDLLEILKPYEWYFCTSPTETQQVICTCGKLLWLQKHYKKDVTNYIFTHHKHLLAQQGTILIDDSSSNIIKFNKAGGVGILWPMRWNQSVWSVEFSIKTRIHFLQEQLERRLQNGKRNS